MHLDNLSFWIGVLAGFLSFLILDRIQAWLPVWLDSKHNENPQPETASEHPDLIRLKNDTLVFAQGWHVAADLFPLDEILIEPRLIAPLPAPDNAVGEAWKDITD